MTSFPSDSSLPSSENKPTGSKDALCLLEKLEMNEFFSPDSFKCNHGAPDHIVFFPPLLWRNLLTHLTDIICIPNHSTCTIRTASVVSEKVLNYSAPERPERRGNKTYTCCTKFL